MGPLADLLGQPVPGAAWKTKPTYYIVGTEDRKPVCRSLQYWSGIKPAET